MNLYRFVNGIGVRPVLCGNIKGLLDHYRNPTTQQEFARTWDQNVNMVTSFADGTKISFERRITQVGDYESYVRLLGWKELCTKSTLFC